MPIRRSTDILHLAFGDCSACLDVRVVLSGPCTSAFQGSLSSSSAVRSPMQRLVSCLLLRACVSVCEQPFRCVRAFLHFCVRACDSACMRVRQVCDLASASPSTVARCGTVYLPQARWLDSRLL
eukprot:6200707-Pleurochrysis_carterae.AAC.8